MQGENVQSAHISCSWWVYIYFFNQMVIKVQKRNQMVDSDKQKRLQIINGIDQSRQTCSTGFLVPWTNFNRSPFNDSKEKQLCAQSGPQFSTHLVTCLRWWTFSPQNVSPVKSRKFDVFWLLLLFLPHLIVNNIIVNW